MTEKELQANVIRLAHLRGWLHYHTYNSIRSPHGWPDLVLCRPPQILFVELKSRTGRVSPMQQNWLDCLDACGLQARLWKPKDWLNGTIEKELK